MSELNDVDEDSFENEFVDEDLLNSLNSSISQETKPNTSAIRDKLEKVSKREEKQSEHEEEDEYDIGSTFEEDMYDDDDDINSSGAWDPDAEEKKSTVPHDVKIKLIVLGVVLVISVILILIFNVSNKSKNSDVNELIPGSTTSQKVQGDSSTTNADKQEKPVKEKPKGRNYTEYVELSDKFFKDTMVVSKYLRAENNVCTYYFTGIPSNFKKEVSFVVDVETYNSIANGSKVSIEYKTIKVNGDDALTGVNVKINK